MDCPNLGKDFTYSDEVSEMIFGFLEDDEFSVSSFESRVETIDEEEEDEENTSNFEESKAFWESQDELLQVKFSHKHDRGSSDMSKSDNFTLTVLSNRIVIAHP